MRKLPTLKKNKMISELESVKTLVGISSSIKEDSFEAGAEIARKALAGNSFLSHTLFFLFATGEHDIDELIRGIRFITGDSPVFLGCTSKGLITKEFISYTGLMVGAGFITSEKPFFQQFFESSIKDREFEAGQSIAKQVMDAGVPADAAFVMFYDSIKQTSSEGAPMLNIATPILEGFRFQYGSWPLIAGIGSFADLNFSMPCKVWANGKTARQGLGIAAISGSLKMDQVILRGTRPIGGYYKITRVEGNVIFELDNRPALEVISGILGDTVSWEQFPFFVTLGVNNGDKYAPYDEDNYFSRLCFAVDTEKKSLSMFETDLTEGMEVQLMRRDIDFSYIQPRINKLLEKLGSRKPVLALYIDCIGRASAFSGMADEESEEVVRAVGDIPFIGMFSGVEIANVGADVKALDWTGVLCIFSEE